MRHNSHFDDLTNKRFGRLEVQSRFTPVGIHPIKWKCACECGQETYVSAANLRNGTTNSCGCLRAQLNGKRLTTHGKTKSSTYRVWSGMRTRCTNPKSTNYSSYGGRGIQCCDRWKSFEVFLEDMGEKPEGKSLDRIDVNGNYEPLNCKWSSPVEQAQNRRKTKLINKNTLINFLKTQTFISPEQAKKLVDNFFKNKFGE